MWCGEASREDDSCAKNTGPTGILISCLWNMASGVINCKIMFRLTFRIYKLFCLFFCWLLMVANASTIIDDAIFLLMPFSFGLLLEIRAAALNFLTTVGWRSRVVLTALVQSRFATASECKILIP